MSTTHQTAPDQAPPGGPRPAALLSGSQLSKSFGPTAALLDGNLELAPGELVAVMGSSGSGKSTLLHCLAGILPPDSGRLTFDGQDMTTMSDSRRSRLRRSEFGFVFQFGQLVPELSAVENVALPLLLNGENRKRAFELARHWLLRLEVDEFANRRPGEISGGQGQRVAVARALVTKPRVIFADEPTGALDSLNGEKVMRLFVAAARETGAAVLLVTHEARVAAYADREVVVRDGRTATYATGA